MTDRTITRFRIEGMDCASCAGKIDTATRRFSGVEDVSVSVTARTMAVTHDPRTDLDGLVRRITGLGYVVARLASDDVPARAAAPRHDHGEGSCCASDACCGHTHAPTHAHSDHGHDHGHDHRHGHAGETSVEPHGAVGHGTAAAAHPEETPWWRSRKAGSTVLAGAALAVAYGLGHLVPDRAALFFVAAIAVGLVPVARRAVSAAFAGTPFSIEMLMTVAALGAIAIGAVEEAAVVVFLFLVGELLEGAAASRARASIRALSDLVPSTARIERDGAIVEIAAAAIERGATLVVRPGDRIAADGTVLDGAGAVDEAPVTGESVPKQKAVGDRVFAGTVNGEGLLRVRVEAAAEDNTIARVVRLVEEAQERKAPTERFIDRFSRVYTPAIVIVAGLVAILPPVAFAEAWLPWIYKGLAILLIGCPCALVISTPAAVAAGLSAGARRGLLMKGGSVLETIGRIDAVAFDKTGTLTRGRPEVTDVEAFAEATPEAVLATAAALDAGSAHPLALAVRGEAARRAVVPPIATAVAAVPGKGVSGRVDGGSVFLGSAAAVAALAPIDEAARARIAARAGEGKSLSLVVRDGVVLGLLAMRDEPRPDAEAGLRALDALGIRSVMLTGDNRATAEAIGRDLRLEVRAELLPEDKQRSVDEMRRSGLRVAKVGDGINDAPALAAADVGIAMGGGTDVALETADAAVLHARVGDVADMVALSRATMANIRQNVAVALGLKALFLVTTVAGITGLWPAILADTGATVLVTANALRLLAWRP